MQRNRGETRKIPTALKAVVGIGGILFFMILIFLVVIGVELEEIVKKLKRIKGKEVKLCGRLEK